MNDQVKGLSPMEVRYIHWFQCLDLWNDVPWIDPITREEYPEVRRSMLRMKGFQQKRIDHDRKKEEAEAKWNK
jgi:hypothetical protein